MRGVLQASSSRLPSLGLGLRWSSFSLTSLIRGRGRRSSLELRTVERLRGQRPQVTRADSKSQLSRQWIRRF